MVKDGEALMLLEALAFVYLKYGPERSTISRINKAYKEIATDRRYKVYPAFTMDNLSGIYYIGRPYSLKSKKFYVERHGACWYARAVNGDLYQKKPCFRLTPIKEGFKTEFQTAVLI